MWWKVTFRSSTSCWITFAKCLKMLFNYPVTNWQVGVQWNPEGLHVCVCVCVWERERERERQREREPEGGNEIVHHSYLALGHAYLSSSSIVCDLWVSKKLYLNKYYLNPQNIIYWETSWMLQSKVQSGCCPHLPSKINNGREILWGE